MKYWLICTALLLNIAACTKTTKQIHDKAIECASSGDSECAAENYRILLKKQPNAPKLQANLGFALTEMGQHEEAVAILQKLISEGEGTYDVYAHYSRSLAGLGRDEEAITWSYRTLELVPSLVDVRGDLAKLLVKSKRNYEALGLLAGFDGYLASKGERPYFAEQRFAILSGLSSAPEVNDMLVKLGKLHGHFYTVLLGKDHSSIPFIIDTSASQTIFSNKVLEALGLQIPQGAKSVQLVMADGTKTMGFQFNVPELQIGPKLLKNVNAIVCERCASLLGQTTLKWFDLTISKADGVEFLNMKPRKG